MMKTDSGYEVSRVADMSLVVCSAEWFRDVEVSF